MCNGTGHITSSIVIDEAIERKISTAISSRPVKKLTLKVGPILGAYLTRGKGFFSTGSILSKWQRTYGCKILLEESSQFSVLQYELYDGAGERLDQ